MIAQTIIDKYFDNGKFKFPFKEINGRSNGQHTHVNLPDASNIWVKSYNSYWFGSITNSLFTYYNGPDKPIVIDHYMEDDLPTFITFNENRIGPFSIIIENGETTIEFLVGDDEISLEWDSTWDKRFDPIGETFCRNETDHMALASLLKGGVDQIELKEFLDG